MQNKCPRTINVKYILRGGGGCRAVRDFDCVLITYCSVLPQFLWYWGSESRLENPCSLGIKPTVNGEFSLDRFQGPCNVVFPLSSWFPYRHESEDHARPWFCPQLVIFLLSTWFPHRLESEDHARPWFCPKLVVFRPSSWFPQRLESEDHTRPWFCPKLVVFRPSSWFPQRLESEDHAKPWFCPKLVVFASK